ETAAGLLALPARATVCPLGGATTEARSVELLARIRPKAILVDGHSAPAWEAAAHRLGIAAIEVLSESHGVAGAFELRMKRGAPSLDGARRVPASTAYLMTTSGTLGRSKLVPLTHAHVVWTSQATGTCLAVGPGDRAGHLTPLYLANGTRTALLVPVLAGGAVNCLAEADVPSLLDEMLAGRVTFTSASFTMMRELLQLGRRDGVPRPGKLRFLRFASGAMEADDIEGLERVFGVPVVAGLASTETGVITHQRLPPAPRVAGSLGPPLGCDIRLVDASGDAVAPGEVGEVLVAGPQVFDGYLDDPVLDAAAFVGRWFRLGDLGRFDERGELRVVGRVKELINRGGEKISPLDVDAALAALPGVAEAAAFAIPHASLGEEVVAAVVLREGAEPDAAGMLDAVRTTLGARRTPRRLWFVAGLPRTDGGKLRRSALPDWVGYRAAADADAAALEGSPLERALAPLWSAVLACDRVARDLAFYAQGGDDERAAHLVAQVEAVFGVAMPPDALREEAATLAAMAQLIERGRGA
ncbi:MAG TPA: AMP-binding protein, partial [Casimicrobiaceae bacterium]|nr:AMP-binding protein [Casimicrobiaceae bacterium]